MASLYGHRPFGLRDVKLTNLAGSTQVDLPAAMTLAFGLRLTQGELQGDDKTMALVAYNDALEGSFEAGGIDLDAYALITGGTVTSAGTSPTRTATLPLSATVCMPYFKIYGKVVSDDCTSDIHAKIWKAKLTKAPQGEFKGGQFYITSAEFVAIDDGSNGIVTFVQNETAANLPTT